MKHKFIYTLVLILLFSSCRNNKIHEPIEEKRVVVNENIFNENTEKYKDDYQTFLKKYNDSFKSKENKNEKKEFFCETIHQSIPDYWIGTAWDFNGVTRTPQKGAIACGYFVTNVLTDLGFKINRIHLAQQASSKMIVELTKNVYRTNSFENLIQHIKNSPSPSVFIIGLDFHTGFISKNQDGKIYFIHSYYGNNQGVIKEDVNQSNALNVSKNYMIGCLSCQEKWFE